VTATYNSTTVGSSGLSTVRFLIGDTSTGTALLTDEEINAVLTNYSSNHSLAAAWCCDSIAATYSRQADTENEGLAVKASQRAAAYTKRAEILRRQAGYGARLFVGGRSEATKDTRAQDTDYVQPFFKRGMDDYPQSSSST